MLEIYLEWARIGRWIWLAALTGRVWFDFQWLSISNFPIFRWDPDFWREREREILGILDKWTGMGMGGRIWVRSGSRSIGVLNWINKQYLLTK
jgi:hypothetical protein